jgi:hypothetical protein
MEAAKSSEDLNMNLHHCKNVKKNYSFVCVCGGGGIFSVLERRQDDYRF